MTTAPNKKTFPIPATCTKCGHSADIFVDDAAVAKALDEYRKSRTLALWQPLVVKRMIISWGIVFMVGIVVGVLIGVWVVIP